MQAGGGRGGLTGCVICVPATPTVPAGGCHTRDAEWVQQGGAELATAGHRCPRLAHRRPACAARCSACRPTLPFPPGAEGAVGPLPTVGRRVRLPHLPWALQVLPPVRRSQHRWVLAPQGGGERQAAGGGGWDAAARLGGSGSHQLHAGRCCSCCCSCAARCLLLKRSPATAAAMRALQMAHTS